MEPDNHQLKEKEEKINLIEEDLDGIPEQKEYSPVAEVLAESIVAAESFWHATVRYLNSFDQRHAVTQRAWEKTAEVGGMAMANPYVASAVTTVTEGVELANTIYAQTMELIQEKRRGLADSFSSSSSSTSTSATTAQLDAESHNSVVVAVHSNEDDLHYEQQQQQQQQQHEQEQQQRASAEPEALALDIQVNP